MRHTISFTTVNRRRKSMSKEHQAILIYGVT
nr:MAG TPA: hypothetical protein [Caudoviricetes sp.]